MQHLPSVKHVVQVDHFLEIPLATFPHQVAYLVLRTYRVPLESVVVENEAAVDVPPVDEGR